MCDIPQLYLIKLFYLEICPWCHQSSFDQVFKIHTNTLEIFYVKFLLPLSFMERVKLFKNQV
jgi:hypothetical protein